VVILGAPGRLGARNVAELSEGVEAPTAFVAVSTNLYVVPGVRPLTFALCWALMGDDVFIVAKVFLSVLDDASAII
jgi:hypothetical protein